MSKYFIISMIILASTNLAFPLNIGVNEACTVGLAECSATLKCIPSQYDSDKFGGFSKEGICLQLIAEGQACAGKSLQKICETGLTCASITGEQLQNGTGTCKKLSDLSKDQTILAVGIPHPIDSNPFSGCKYLPGNYFFDSASSDDCCGITRKISDPSVPTQNLSDLKYCDWVNPGEQKTVNTATFCGKDQYGQAAVWESQNTPVIGSLNTPGRCLAPLPYDPTLLLVGADPEYTWDETQCLATFKDQDLESRVGLRSNWEGFGTYQYWFTSLPEEKFYRVGDEAFMMAYMWLFKNTDVESSNGVNLLAKGLAKKLYDSFDQYYSKSFRDANDLMNTLDDLKKCVSLQNAPLAFQLRYQVTTLMEEGLLGTVRAYQCGGIESLDKATLNCSNDKTAFFRSDFTDIYNASTQEAGRCMDTLQSCQKTLFIGKWEDNKRKDFIITSVKKTANVDLGDLFGGPYRDLGINGLVDPPINTGWVPEKFKTDVSALFTELNIRNPNIKVEFTSDGREPTFYWQIIIDPGKIKEAFATDSNGSMSFLHYNDKMPYFTQEEMAYHTSAGVVPGASEATNWHGPYTIAGEAVRIMEQFSAADNNGDPVVATVASILLGGPAIAALIAAAQKNRQFHTVYHTDVVPYRLARLIQYYSKKLEAVQKEKACLLGKIKLMATASGIDSSAADFDPVKIQIDTRNPGCGSGKGGGSNSNSSTDPKDNSLALSDTDIPVGDQPTMKKDGEIQGTNFQGILIDVGSNFQNPYGSKNGVSTVSLSSIHKSSSLSDAAKGSASAAIRDAAKKQKEGSLLAYKKRQTENGTHPAVVAQEKIGQLAPALFSKVQSSTPFARGSQTLDGISAAPTEGSGSGEATAEEHALDLAATEKKWGVLPSEKIKIGGTVANKKTAPGAVSSTVSYTGLTPIDEQHILQNIRNEDVGDNEDDSLWRKVSKAYVKSYIKLFAPKEAQH